MRSTGSTGRSAIKVTRAVGLLVALLASLVLAGCGGDEQAQDGSGEDQGTTNAQTAEQTEQGASGQSASAGQTEETRMNENTAGGGSGQEVTLKIEGDPGTAFSGVCGIGDREEEVVGETPQTYTYDLSAGQEMNCEIRKSGTDSSSLKVTLTAPGNNIVQQTNTPGGSINLSFSGSGVTSSASSVSSSSVNSSSSSSR